MNTLEREKYKAKNTMRVLLKELVFFYVFFIHDRKPMWAEY